MLLCSSNSKRHTGSSSECRVTEACACMCVREDHQPVLLLLCCCCCCCSQERLKAVCNEVADSPRKIVLFIDDIHNLVPNAAQQVGGVVSCVCLSV